MSSTANTNILLNIDPLLEAEQLTGKSYKDDEATGLLGLLISSELSDIKKQHLTALDDTTFSNTLERYQRIITDMGFELVLELPFTSSYKKNETEYMKERYFIYAHRDGLILSFDTYGTEHVNGGKVYYCWKPLEGTNRWTVTSSGGWHNDETGGYWAGNHDCREALRHKIQGLRDNGTLLAQWPKGNDQFIWLLHYEDTKEEGYDYDAINKERIGMLPEWAQTIINR